MKINYKGLLHEILPSGADRWRVRVAGDPKRRVKLNVSPDNKAFMEHYKAAREGVQLSIETAAGSDVKENTISWLTYEHTKFIEKQVAAGNASPLTLKKRIGLYQKLRNRCGEYGLDMPASEVRLIQDDMMNTPAMADSMVEAIRSLFAWAVDRGMCNANPTVGLTRIDKGKGGAKPWTMQDIRQYIERHPAGTRAHTTLMLFLFTACRIGDAIWIGRGNEFEENGQTFIGWQPQKKGSVYVEVPMTPQLRRATRSAKVVGKSYLLKANGEPYEKPDNLGQQFRKWVRQAGLEDRSAHGIRKSVGGILANLGCSQYQIMCIHGHTQAKTSEVYTKGLERRGLAKEAMEQMENIKW